MSKVSAMNYNLIIDNLRSHNKRTLARLISLVENDDPQAEGILNATYPHTGNAYRIGITGPPGAGKSSITNNLVKVMLSAGKRVGIIAVDPTSPYTGGALLGDRIRMSDIGSNDGVFIRSMATRGSLGGLNTKTRDVADLLDAAGYDYIIIETVGVGQSELDIVKTTDTVMVVLVPESGDSIQAMKAGLMEIADLFVVNKSDRPGAEHAVNAIKAMLMMRDHNIQSWIPSIITSVASENLGLVEILREVQKHNDYLLETNLFKVRRNKQLEGRIKEIVESKIIHKLWSDSPIYAYLEFAKDETGSISPHQIAEDIITKFKKNVSVS